MNKLVQNKSIFQKIIVTCIVVVLVSFMCPIYSHADDEWTLMGSLIKELTSLVRSLGDIVEGLLNHFMLGTSKLTGSSMLERDDPNITTPGSAVYADDTSGPNVVSIPSDELDETLIKGNPKWKVPNMLYSPENIFANKIAALDVNFINPHTYSPVQTGENSEEAQKMSVSAAQTLSDTISTWYKSFRNISVVALLSVLVYMGIRILLATTAQDKAKYKEAIKDWAVALCLVFMIHFIMSATMIFVDKVTQLFGSSAEQGVVINVTGDDSVTFKTNFMGYMRFRSQSSETGDVVAYTIIYLVLIIQTVMFTIQYLKRLLYMAFFTMIAPLVALTYPIDKMGDGQAQAFNMWFKEYTLNAILQPVHLLLYTMLITSAMSLAVNNPIYAIVAIGFLVPAEKFIKKMFKLDRAESEEGLGGFAGGALAMTGFQKLAKTLGDGGKKAEKSGSGDSGKIRTQDNNTALPGSDNKDLAAWKDGNNTNNNDSENNSIRQTYQDNLNQNNYADVSETQNRDEANAQQLGVGTDEIREENINDYNTEGIQESEENVKGYENRESDSNIEETDPVKRLKAMGAPTKGMSNKQKIKGFIGKVNSAAPAGVKVLGRGAKAAGKKIWKNKRGILRRAAGIAGGVTLGGMGAMIGAASAIAQGDAGKVLTNASAGAAAGYIGGSSFGRGTVDLAANAGNATAQSARAIANTYNEEKYGLDEARKMRLEKENEKAKKAFMKNDAEKRKYKDMTAKINAKNNTNFSIDDVMSAAYDYKNAGVNEDKISTALNMEIAHSNGDKTIGDKNQNHDRMINVMQEVGHFSQDYILDDKKRESLEKSMKAQLGDKKGQDFMDLFAEAHGQDDYYNKIKEQRKATQSQTQSGIVVATEADLNNELNTRRNNQRGRNTSRNNNTRRGNSSGDNSGNGGGIILP